MVEEEWGKNGGMVEEGQELANQVDCMTVLFCLVTVIGLVYPPLFFCTVHNALVSNIGQCGVSNNFGGCQQLCLPSSTSNTPTCACYIGYHKLNDGTCVTSKYILVCFQIFMPPD